LNLENAKRILVIRFSSLGDILLTTLFLRVLKKKFPTAKIDFLVRTSFVDAVKFNPNIEQVFFWQMDVELDRTVEELKLNEYDFVVDLQNNFRSKKVVKKLSKKSYSFNKPNIKKFLLVNTKLNFLKNDKSIPERYVEVVPELKLDNKGLELFIPDEIKSELKSDEDIVGLSPGAFHYTKRWPIEYYAELGNKLTVEGFTIVIFGGKSDGEICNDLQNRVTGSLDLSNDNQLFNTAVDMKKCKLIVCNDSGLMHTATSVGVPVVSIFGSTVQEFGFAPFGVKNLIIENNSLNCRPCSHIGKSTCKKKHFKCMTELTPQLIFDEIKGFAKKL
jgi:lipopolysaccharide heptosyltransferase II